MIKYLDCNKLLPKHQSAYRNDHSVETSLTKVLAKLVTAMDEGELGFLAL